jgi:hypothetical protein
MNIENIINEEIVSHQQNAGQPMPENPEYNGGQREEIMLPPSIARDLLRHPDYMFEVIFDKTSEAGENARLFFNGKNFIINILQSNREYFAHVSEEQYSGIKQRYQGLN